MTRELFNEMFERYNSIIKRYGYSEFFNICQGGRLKSILGDNCKVTYCGYSVINFSNGYFFYSLHENGNRWELNKKVDCITQVDKNKCQVSFYHDREWTTDTTFSYSACYTYYPYFCKNGKYEFTINNVIPTEVEEDNKNAILVALKYGISYDDARKAVYGE